MDRPVDNIGNMSSSSDAKKQAQAETSREWQAFPELPGTHLSWRKVGWEKRELMASGGEVWATITRSIVKPTSIADDTGTYEKRPLQPRQGGTHQWVDAAGKSICIVRGRHYSGRAHTSMALADHGIIAFPVTGRWNRAVMSAIDESDNTLVRYRLNPTSFNIPIGNPPGGCNLKRVEAVITPSAHASPGISFLVASTCNLILNYFQHSGGG